MNSKVSIVVAIYSQSDLFRVLLNKHIRIWKLFLLMMALLIIVEQFVINMLGRMRELK